MKDKGLEYIRARMERFTKIPDSEWEVLKNLFVLKYFEKSQRLVSAGEMTKDLAFVIEGIFRAYFIDSKGKEFTRTIMCKGDIACAYSEILQKRPSYMHIEAIESSVCLVLNHDDLEKLYDRHPCWQILGRKICEYYFIGKEQRIVELLQLEAKDRYNEYLRFYGHLGKRIPQYIVASYLGISPVSLSRLLHKSDS